MKRQLSADTTSALLRQLAAASRHGLPLHEVAGILSRDPQSVVGGRPVLHELAQALAGGEPLAAAMRRAPEAFSAASANWVEQAARHGALPATLVALALDFEQRAEARRALRRVLAWPAWLAASILALFLVTAVFVMPAFSEVYASFGVALPVLSRGVFAFGRFLAGGWWWWLPLGALLVLAVVTRRVPARLVAAGDAALDALPFVRRWRRARFVLRLLAGLRAHPADRLLQAASLSHLAATTRGRPLAGTAARLQAALAGGAVLSDALAAEPLLPPRLSLFARLGERMGDLSAPLAQLGEVAEQELRDALAGFERGVMLLLYALFGLAVGTLVVAVYLPIFKLGAIV